MKLFIYYVFNFITQIHMNNFQIKYTQTQQA